MSNGNNTLGRFSHFGRATTFNPFLNSQDLKSLADQWFYIPNQSAFTNSSTLLVSTGLITNEVAFLNNFSAEIVNVNGTVIKSLTARLGELGNSKEPRDDEILWFDIEGMQGDYFVHNSYAGKILRINGKFECSAIVAEEMNSLTGCIMGFTGSLASIPNRALVCQGQAISRFYYSKLFSIIGTRFGAGDGALTFNLPDLRDATLKGCNGEKASGVGGSVLNDPDNVNRFAGKTGGASGTNVGSYQIFATQFHNSEPHIHSSLSFRQTSSNSLETGTKNTFYEFKGSQFWTDTKEGTVKVGTGQSTRDNNVYVHHIIFI